MAKNKENIGDVFRVLEILICHMADGNFFYIKMKAGSVLSES